MLHVDIILSCGIEYLNVLEPAEERRECDKKLGASKAVVLNTAVRSHQATNTVYGWKEERTSFLHIVVTLVRTQPCISLDDDVRLGRAISRE